MVGAITASSTQSFDITAETGNHELRFTFFDGSGDGTTTTGSFDEVYVYQKEGNLVVWETFTQNEGNFKLRNRVNETTTNSVRMFASESKLNLYKDEGGAGSTIFDRIRIRSKLSNIIINSPLVISIRLISQFMIQAPDYH